MKTEAPRTPRAPAPRGSDRQRVAGNEHNTANRLRALLSNDREAACLVLSKADMINRRHYARLLNLTPSAMTAHQEIFVEFEQQVDTRTGPTRLLESMRQWLTDEYKSRRIELRDGKIDRQAFAKQFGLRGGTFMSRHPQIRNLIQEFDALAAKENYLPASLEQSVASLKHALAGAPPLNKDRKSINLESISKLTGIPTHKFLAWPYKGILAEKQDEVTARVKQSRIDPYFHDRVYAFSDLSNLLSVHFLERIGIRFKQFASGLSKDGTKGPYQSLYKLLSWIATSSNGHCKFVRTEAMQVGRIMSQTHWEEAVFAYRATLTSEIDDNRKIKTGIDSAITALRTSLDGLSSGGIVPAMSVPLPGLKLADRTGSKRKSLAEATKTDLTRDASLDYIEFARSCLTEARQRYQLPEGQDDEDFLQVLAQEIGAQDVLPNKVSEAVLTVLRRRLSALRSNAVKIVEAAAAELRLGKVLLEQSDLDVEDFVAKYFNMSLNRHEKNKLLRAAFPLPNESISRTNQRALANLLRLIQLRHGGIPPSVEASQIGGYGQFFAKRYLELGGQRSISAMLIPDAEAVGATLTLYLVDSGANISVGRTLAVDCMEPSDSVGHRRITGNKARAKGKPIIIDLPESSPAVTSMHWLARAGQSLRAQAGEDADRFFVARIGGNVENLPPHWYTAHFTRFAGSIEELHGVHVLPSMIRSSVLLEAALSNDGRLKTGMAIGQNTESVAQGYQQKWPTRLLYDQNIRRFTNSFEALVLASVPDATQRMRVSTGVYEERQRELTPTGLGTLCSSKGKRSDSTDQRCAVDCWNDCPNMLIVADVDSVATLQLWQKSLRQAEPDWQRDRPERWDEVWLPWLCLTDVVEEKMKRGPLLKIWRSAENRASELSSSNGFVVPRPW